MPEDLRAGECVRLHSLKGRADLNGAIGTILRYDVSKGRYAVETRGESVLLKLANLERQEEEAEEDLMLEENPEEEEEDGLALEENDGVADDDDLALEENGADGDDDEIALEDNDDDDDELALEDNDDGDDLALEDNGSDDDDELQLEENDDDDDDLALEENDDDDDGLALEDNDDDDELALEGNEAEGAGTVGGGGVVGDDDDDDDLVLEDDPPEDTIEEISTDDAYGSRKNDSFGAGAFVGGEAYGGGGGAYAGGSGVYGGSSGGGSGGGGAAAGGLAEALRALQPEGGGGVTAGGTGGMVNGQYIDPESFLIPSARTKLDEARMLHPQREGESDAAWQIRLTQMLTANDPVEVFHDAARQSAPAPARAPARRAC